ncbi:hypothetical protein NMS_0390 [Nonlabens marinus S1-08]|uniref:Uncharacterized protein n=2 Tax=Nonlabens TaxID=363408 RepID=W8VNE1_9FLAO|nr:hypothetical protein NMS_0390 [Nonlabens marinus S1-08]
MSCKTGEIFAPNPYDEGDVRVNSKLNREYKKSRQSFFGQLSKADADQLRDSLQSQLQTKIDPEKAILINYEQFGTNCLIANASLKTKDVVAHNGIRISARMSKKYNAVDFFVYEDIAEFQNIYEAIEKYQSDPGFFKSNLFTSDQNCGAFFLLKPDGSFLKHYGEDYFTEVDNFFKMN